MVHVLFYVKLAYPEICALYEILTACPIFVLSSLMYSAVRSGHIFFTICPPMEPASREVREPL